MSLMKINNIIVAIVVYVIFAALIQLAANPSSYSAFAVGETQQVWQPDIKASDIYQYYTMVLGKDIKNLVILLPNEGHEDPTSAKGVESCQSTIPSSECSSECWYYGNMV